MRPFNVRSSLFFQKHSITIAFVVLVVFVALGLFIKSDTSWLPAVVAAAAAFLSLNQQKIDHDRARRELFSFYNGRYNTLNEDLNQIFAEGMKDTPAKLEPDQKYKLFDYFNLCAEEHLSYCDGYVDEIVWKAWGRGMKEFLKDKRIESLLREEIIKGSYYGFDIDAL